MRILILYNHAREIKTGDEQDLICEQEISVIVPLVSEALLARGYTIDTLETTLNVWEDLKTKRDTFDLVLNMAEAFGVPTRMRRWCPRCLRRLRYHSREHRRRTCMLPLIRKKQNS